MANAGYVKNAVVGGVAISAEEWVRRTEPIENAALHWVTESQNDSVCVHGRKLLQNASNVAPLAVALAVLAYKEADSHATDAENELFVPQQITVDDDPLFANHELTTEGHAVIDISMTDPAYFPRDFPRPKSLLVKDDHKVEMVMIAFKGSRLSFLPSVIRKDWLETNIAQSDGTLVPRYKWASEFVQLIMSQHPNALFVLSGHSMGGGMAAYAAIVNNVAAITLNPAGLGAATLQSAQAANQANPVILNFIARNNRHIDIVSALSLSSSRVATSMPGSKYLVTVDVPPRLGGPMELLRLHGEKNLVAALMATWFSFGFDFSSIGCDAIVGP